MTAGRRSLVALVAAAAMLVPAAAAPAAGSRIVLVTQNVRVTLGPVHARHDVRQAARGADVLALQEMNRRRVTRYLPASWHAWQARGPAGETAVAWRPARFRLIGGVPLLLHRSTLFRSATRYAAAVMLGVRGSNRCLTVVSVHMAPHIDNAGRLTSLRRGKLAAIALRTFAAAGRMFARSCAVAIGGDWNLDAYASRRARDPRAMFARMTAAGFRGQWYASPIGPTLGRRTVDGFWVRRLDQLGQRVIAGTYSDHNGVRLTVRLGGEPR